MPWIKLNHNAPFHPKIAGLSDRSFRVWIRSLCYAAQFQTDGVLPTVFLASIPRRAYEELVAASLWCDDQDTVTIHDYLQHQTSKAKIDADRERNALRQALHRTARNAVTTPLVTAKSRDKKKEVKKEEEVLPPNPPHEGGRVRREHREQAKAILRSRMGYCEHEPQCLNQVICLDLIAHELAEKAKAS